MHQGFPKFVEHIAFTKDDTLVLVAPLASEINTMLNDEKISLSIDSKYPFQNNATIKINEGNFNILIQRPEFVESIFINDKEFLMMRFYSRSLIKQNTK